MAKQTYSVLLVDDCEDDRLFARRAFTQHPKFAVAGEVCDGEAAIAWLAGLGEFSNREKFPFPDVVVLDLKMPRLSGHELLAWLQTQAFDGLRVVVLSGSLLPADMDKSRELGADAHYQKDVCGPPRAMMADLAAMLDRPS